MSDNIVHSYRKLVLEKLRCIKRLQETEEMYKENLVFSSSDVQRRYLIFCYKIHPMIRKTILFTASS